MEKIKMQPTRPEDALLTDAFADFLEKCRAKNLSEKTLNIYTVHFKFFREYLSDPDKKASDITEDTLEGFILYLQNRGCNDITVQSYMRGVRCFCYYLMEEEYLQRFKIKLPKADKRIKETYTDTELKKLLKKPNVKTCEFNEYKTWVFSNYLLATGNRISTVLSLQIKDLDTLLHFIASRPLRHWNVTSVLRPGFRLGRCPDTQEIFRSLQNKADDTHLRVLSDGQYPVLRSEYGKR